ncbi:ParA family protein [Aureimonas frigidaquae]|uniref:ParA family protein n=1 Tax=Aureimonas frigidaquae TaxID=424757 RepID=UPI0007845569|nr:AAA family ATPase [Aureimonas frigidaquae]
MTIIACYSNKGGVGKTAVSVNLAYAVAAAGQRVLLCDLDPQGASSFYFRIKPSGKLTEESFFKKEEKFAKAIRESDYPGLDVLPSNTSFKDFDTFLAGVGNSRSRLKKTLKAAGSDYDVILLDCPPNISLLSQNVFAASDAVLVPIIPTTLSERTFEQLVDLFKDSDLPLKTLHGFFSMAQSVKSLHNETMEALRRSYPERILETVIPFASDVERMGVHRAPVLATAPNSASARAYRALHAELMQRIDAGG